MKYCAVVFDAFGTLLEISERRSPYLKLMRWLRESGRTPSPHDSTTIMTHPGDLSEMASLFGKSLPSDLLAEIESDLIFETQHLRAYPDSLETIKKIKAQNIKVGICSNLAEPYGDAVKAILSGLDAYVFSYEVGAVKPNRAMFQEAIDQLQCSAETVLFVGDNPYADKEGAISFGMDAILIDRNRGLKLDDILAKIKFMPPLK